MNRKLPSNIRKLLTKNEQKLLDYPTLRPTPRECKLYKYLTFENGKLMLENSNIQFTISKELNDKDDCNISMINFDSLKTGTTDVSKQIDTDIISGLKDRISPEIDSFHICSLGTSSNNKTLWERYSGNDGLCIELNYSKIINHLIDLEKRVVSYRVNYISTTREIIPFELYKKGETELFFYLLFQTKSKEWEAEQETRITLVERSLENYIRVILSKECFSKVYIGKHCSDSQIAIIKETIAKSGLNIDIEHCPLPI